MGTEGMGIEGWAEGWGCGIRCLGRALEPGRGQEPGQELSLELSLELCFALAGSILSRCVPCCQTRRRAQGAAGGHGELQEGTGGAGGDRGGTAPEQGWGTAQQTPPELGLLLDTHCRVWIIHRSEAGLLSLCSDTINVSKFPAGAGVAVFRAMQHWRHFPWLCCWPSWVRRAGPAGAQSKAGL